SNQQTACYQGQDQAYLNDSYLCSDALSTEKHVSAAYNTCIFEFRDQNVRNALNHLQKEEQQHGKMVYDYMSANGMYN
ncbi:MAG: spore coat protein, partial [Bacillota bacterium]|nr:spore coat protein [Bacillota bacterium]